MWDGRGWKVGYCICSLEAQRCFIVYKLLPSGKNGILTWSQAILTCSHVLPIPAFYFQVLLCHVCDTEIASNVLSVSQAHWMPIKSSKPTGLAGAGHCSHQLSWALTILLLTCSASDAWSPCGFFRYSACSHLRTLAHTVLVSRMHFSWLPTWAVPSFHLGPCSNATLFKRSSLSILV